MAKFRHIGRTGPWTGHTRPRTRRTRLRTRHTKSWTGCTGLWAGRRGPWTRRTLSRTGKTELWNDYTASLPSNGMRFFVGDKHRFRHANGVQRRRQTRGSGHLFRLSERGCPKNDKEAKQTNGAHHRISLLKESNEHNSNANYAKNRKHWISTSILRRNICGINKERGSYCDWVTPSSCPASVWVATRAPRLSHAGAIRVAFLLFPKRVSSPRSSMPQP